MDASLTPDLPDELLAAAMAVLRQHVPDRDGWCRGCSEVWGRLVFIDQRTQVRWAKAVQAAYGAARRGDEGMPSD
jgi:hypothetical protein